MSAEDDKKSDKSELIQGEGSVTYTREGTKLLSKNINTQLPLFFAS